RHHVMHIRTLSVPLLFLVLGLPACTGNLIGPSDSPLIESFVNDQNLPDRHATKIILRNADLRLTFFRVHYGHPVDCESGCIYSALYGLKFSSKIGWIKPEIVEQVAPEDLSFFDVESTDTALFKDKLWTRLETVDSWMYWGAFIPMLAGDPDTPAPKLLAIAAQLIERKNTRIAWILLDNPIVQVDRQILIVLVTLPWSGYDIYDSIKQRAQEFLNALGPSRQ
ncbi:hypothetical protein ACFL39_01540, partial [Gemmatimonadota bacterium]